MSKSAQKPCIIQVSICRGLYLVSARFGRIRLKGTGSRSAILVYVLLPGRYYHIGDGENINSTQKTPKHFILTSTHPSPRLPLLPVPSLSLHPPPPPPVSPPPAPSDCPTLHPNFDRSEGIYPPSSHRYKYLGGGGQTWPKISFPPPCWTVRKIFFS